MDDLQFDKLYDIFKDFPAKMATLKEWEKSYRRAALMENLYEHDAVKHLLTLFASYVKENDLRLQSMQRSDFTNDALFFDQRVRLEAEKNCWNLLIAFFTNAKSTKEAIAQNVKDTEKQNLTS